MSEQAEKTNRILALMSEGGAKSLRDACRQTSVAPATFLDWVAKSKELSEQYAHARDAMIDIQAEELDEIGDRAARADNAVEVAGLRLKSDNRKWLLSKLAPRKYGDKQSLEMSGEIKVRSLVEELSSLNAITDATSDHTLA
jgi:hypothetical protein